MKNQTIFSRLSRAIYFYLFFSILFTACTFPKAVRKYKDHDYDKAQSLFERSVKHRTYGKGAKFYLEQLKARKAKNTLEMLAIVEQVCLLEKEMEGLSYRQVVKLKGYDASQADVIKFMEQQQTRVRERMSTTGSIKELKALISNKACWPEETVDSLRIKIVNKTVNPAQIVFEEESKWKGAPLTLAKLTQVKTEKGRSCKSLYLKSKLPKINYNDVGIIFNEFFDDVLPINYDELEHIRKKLWDIFQRHESYCKMDQFKADYPNNLTAKDCWFDAGQDTLCLSELRPLLAFHRNNPHTALDFAVCNQILCLADVVGDETELTIAEKLQVDDVRLMFKLLEEVSTACMADIDSIDLINSVAYLAKKYKHHKLIANLAMQTLDFFATDKRYDLARKGLEVFRPLYPDTIVCTDRLFFQVNKQEWFNLFEGLLDLAYKEPLYPGPMLAWNTTENDESNLISWEETDEVFFVRRSPITGVGNIMTSKFNKKGWSKPKVVKPLSIAWDAVPLSISSGGREMLLKSQGKLYRSFRLEKGRKWSKPEVMNTPSRFGGTAWLSPDDSLLIMEYYPKSTNQLLKKDIMVAKLSWDDTYKFDIALDEKVNQLDWIEGNPIMALGGRLLFFTSDRGFGLGGMDMYSASMKAPRAWSTMEDPKLLGLPLNRYKKDNGLTYFSEYTGNAYFHRFDNCSKTQDIWVVRLNGRVFPANAMRLAGVVLDENGKPIEGGFVEFTADYQLNVHSEPISEKGTFTYTVADQTEVVRVFPEVPGYYSERDTTHFLGNIKQGEILRDTFRLTSFDYIRKHFKLVHSTFYNGVAEFDRPEKAFPELNRLAKIATRMGAEIVLTGHTDNTGAESGNSELSLNRAKSVKRFLVEKCGFDASRIKVFHFGASKPICPNNTEEGRRCNRRVEVVFNMPELTHGKLKRI